MALSTAATHGTGVPITKEFVVDMPNILYRLDPAQNPFLVFANMFPKVTCHNYMYEWLMREGFDRRTFTGKWIKTTNASHAAEIMLGLQLNARDWNAIAMIAKDLTTYQTAAGHVRVNVTNQDGEETAANEVHLIGYIKRSAYENGHMRRKLYNASGDVSADYYYNTVHLSRDAASETTLKDQASNEGEVIIEETYYVGSSAGNKWDDAKIANGETCFVTIEFPNMQAQGYAQGSGLGKESKKISIHDHNVTQIFKSVVNISGTLEACTMIGGPERLKRQFETGRSHASDMEFAMIFQGGGTEGVGGDWGVLDNNENPKTRFKGLGVAHAAGKEGFIISNNGNPLAGDPTPCQVTAGSPASYTDFMERIYDDIKNGSPNKTMFTSLMWISDLSKIALNDQKYFTLNLNNPFNQIGVNVRRIETPFGTLDMIHHPTFTGPYRRYGLIVDMKNIALRPLNGRDTKLHVNCGSGEIDGTIDEYRTEFGLEVRHEWTHAIGYLKPSS